MSLRVETEGWSLRVQVGIGTRWIEMLEGRHEVRRFDLETAQDLGRDWAARHTSPGADKAGATGASRV